MFESLQRTAAVGSFNVPWILILLVFAWIIYSIIARFIYRGRENQLKTADNIIFTAGVIILLGWKLSPIIFQFQTVIGNPSSLLYLPGGIAGIFIGAAGAAIYIVLSLLRIDETRITAVRNLFISVAVLAAAIVVAFSAGAFLLSRSAAGESSKEAGKGSMAPLFLQEGIDGNTYSLADYAGKTVVINFWASWCPPCRAELPELIEFYNETDAEELVFLSVNMYETEQNPEDLPEFIEKEMLPFPVILDRGGEIANAYGVNSIPVTVVIDPDGIIGSMKNGAVTAAWLKSAVR